MYRWQRWFGAALLVICSQTGWADKKTDLDQLLLAADEQRSASPERYEALLNQLRLATAEMTAEQRDYLNFLLAYQAAYTDQYQQAEQLFKALMLPTKPVILRFRAAFTLANVQIVRRQFVDAFSSLAFAMSMLPEVEDAKWRNRALLSAANIYSESGLFRESEDFLQQLVRAKLEPRDLCISQYLHVQNQQALNITQTIAEIEQVSAQCEQAGEHMIAQLANVHRAIFHLNNKAPQDALSFMLKSMPEIEKTRYNRLLIQAYQVTAQAQAELGKTADAMQMLAKLIQTAHNLPNSTPLVAGLKLQAELLAKQGNFEAAFLAHQQFADAERAMRDERSAQALAYQRAQGELLNKNQQLRLVKEEFRVLELESQLKDQREQRSMIYITLLSTASILLIYITYRLLRRHRYYKLAAENDGLTGISNRHFFDLQLQKQVKRCKQQQKSLGVIVFDLDLFKQINDKYGHEIGDKALQATVQICNHFIRSGDIFGRIGGEEFAIVLPDCQPDKVLMLAEICRDAIEQLDCSEIQPGLKLSASFGVSYSQISGYQANDLMRHADQALYLAKYNGRNRVESYDQMQPHPGRSLINSPSR
ncbi:MAG: GGDEF domain-containing protein [Rheinheimera sp.]|nr:MAG: GGDEF domain-containing protein [Rheinheimera sp.]